MSSATGLAKINFTDPLREAGSDNCDWLSWAAAAMRVRRAAICAILVGSSLVAAHREE
ncbi:MAG: hypothetical protein ACLQU1_18590 [Bryobacteraceae bacterium]